MKSRLMLFVVIVAIFCTVSACSLLGPAQQYYTFTYEFRQGNQHVAVLSYRLWAGDVTIVRFEPNVNQKKSYTESISPRNIGPIPQFLTVSWIDEATNKIFQETADLRPRMPTHLEENVIYFTLAGNKLKVYLADLKGESVNPLSDLSPYSSLSAITLYP